MEQFRKLLLRRYIDNKGIKMAHENNQGCPYLTTEDIEQIAENAADKAVKKITDQVYLEVGKSVINKFLWALGAITVGFVMWLHSKGFI